MAVLPMLKVNIYGLKKDRKKILEKIQQMGMIEIHQFEEDDKNLKAVDTGAFITSFQKAKNDCLEALEIIKPYVASKNGIGFLGGKKTLTREEFDALSKSREETVEDALKIINLRNGIEEKRADLIKLDDYIKELIPWQNLDISMNLRETKTAKVFVGTIPYEADKKELLEKFEEISTKKNFENLLDKVYVEIINKSENITRIIVICHKNDETLTGEVLKSLGFSELVQNSDKTPREEIESYESQKRKDILKIKEAEEKLIEYARKSETLRFMADHFEIRIQKYKAINKVMETQSAFLLSGYIPEKDKKIFNESLSKKFNVEVEYEKSDEEAPVLLRNKAFAEPLEGVLETFSLPTKGEVDPTAVMAVFYYFLFGIMLSDAGYGALMVIFSALLLWRFKNMEAGMKKTFKMFLYCGISTLFWGIMFGGYFGDAISVISKTFFKKEVLVRPLWFSPMDEPMRMLIFSLLLGIIHLFSGLGVKLYILIRQKKWKDAIYDVIFWYLLVGGAIVYLLSVKMFKDMAGLKFTLPTLAKNIAALSALLGALGIILTSGRDSKNPFKRIAKGLYGLYNVTGYLSDILSYSRLLALGLATGVIANVFNKMGSMLGGGVLGVIGFTVIFILGHTLNLGINLLGAYVHTNRLQFVEFFGKFYDGGGRKFAPFKAEALNYRIEDK